MDDVGMKKVPALFFKAHVDTYTRKDGTVVQAHDDKRQAHKETLKRFHEAHVPDSENHLSHVPDHKMRQFDKGHIDDLKASGHIEHGDITNGDNEYDDRGHYITEKGRKALAGKGDSLDRTPKEAAELRDKFHSDVRKPNAEWFSGGSTLLKPGAPPELRAKVDDHKKNFAAAMSRAGK